MTDIFEEGTRREIRFTLPEGSTPSGELTIEQLWKIKPSTKVINGERKTVDYLADYETDLQDEVESFGKKTRRGAGSSKTVSQELVELRLAIVTHILDIRDKEAAEARTEADKKAHNQKIMGLMAKKQEDALEGLSIDELKAMLK